MQRLCSLAVEPTKARSVLVLGAGLLGSAIANALLQSGDRVTVVTRSAPTAYRESLLAGATVHVTPITVAATLAHLLAETEHVVYALGSFSPAESAIAPTQEMVTVLPMLVDLLEMLRLRGGVDISFLSSGGAVYGNQSVMPIPESTHAKPVSAYGITKLACEAYLTMYHDLYGVRARICRIANVYGPGQIVSRGQGLIATLIDSALNGTRVPLYGDMSSERDYIHVDDAAEAVAELLGRPETPSCVNIGTGVGTTIGDVLDIVTSVVGFAPKIKMMERRPFDVRANILDVATLSNVISWSPRTPREGITDVWALIEKYRGDALGGRSAHNLSNDAS
jgi:UDP-glucose 4-epimerase